MKTILFFVLTLISSTVFGQSFSLSDTTITYKSASGKVMSMNEAIAYMQQGTFNTETKTLPNGRKAVTLSRPDEEENSKKAKEIYEWMFKLRGTALPSCVLQDGKGKTITNKELKGRAAIINFWFTQCKPCLAEMPDLNNLAKNKSNENIVFLGITYDSSQTVRNFLSRFPFDFRIIPNAQTFIDRLKITTYPTTLIVDKSGIIRDVFVGSDPDLSTKLQTAIDLLK